LRKLWNLAGLDEAILTVLAKHPEAVDRDKFLFGLSSPQQATVRLSLEALEKLPGKDVEAKHILALVLALRRLGDTKEEKPLQERLGKYLASLTGQDKLGSDKKAWTDWFAKEHPVLAARLGGPDGVDVQAWGRRLAKIDWTKGEASRGIGIFTKASCASCHSGAQALGPDLRGVTGRFSRDDLLTAIIQPRKDIAARYRTTQIETADGKIYQGLVIYEAVDSMILQTGPAATIRLNSPQIVGKRFTDISLMPAGLLDPLKDEEIADLLAYLKSLGTSSK
jgi:putative heme-binding domain-containing protein